MLAFYVAILDTEEQKDKFTEIYTTYYGMMYQVARAITHDDKLAEDALHEAQKTWWVLQQDAAEARALGSGTAFERQDCWPLIPVTDGAES